MNKLAEIDQEICTFISWTEIKIDDLYFTASYKKEKYHLPTKRKKINIWCNYKIAD